MREIFNLLFITLVLFSAQGQKNRSFEHITSEQGLSQNDVNSICQDKQGFIWFATHDGLNRYDGHEFKIYRPEADNDYSIQSNLIRQVTVDNDGFIWIINNNKGISRFNPSNGTATQFTHNPQDANSLSSNIIYKLYTDSQNRLWILSEKGLGILDINKLPEDRKIENYNVTPNTPNASLSYSTAIFEDSNNQIWIGTGAGLFKAFESKKGKMIFVDVSIQEGLWEKSFINSIEENSIGGLSLTARSGLYYKAKSDVKFKLVNNSSLNAVAFDSDNNLWGSNSEGLFFYNYDSKLKTYKYKSKYSNDILVPSSLSKDAIKDLFIDDSNVLWIGTKGGGVNKMNPKGNPFYTIKKTTNKNSLSHSNVRSVFVDSNMCLWVGTENGALNVSTNSISKNTKDTQFNSFSELTDVFAITEVDISNKAYLFVGTEYGLNSLKKVALKKEGNYKINDFKNVKSDFRSVFAIKQTKDKSIWIGTYYKGVHRWIPKKDGSFSKTNFSEILGVKIIRSFLQDSKGNLWIATANGLFLIEEEELLKEPPKFKIFKHNPGNSKSISHDYILSLFEDSNGTLWVGTFGGGLNYFSLNEQNNLDTVFFEKYTIENGLSNDIIKFIVEDDKKNLWITSNKGITKISLKTKEIRNYDVNDGLQGNEFSELAGFKYDKSNLIFGGIKGLNTFNSSKIIDNQIEAKPLLTNLFLLNEKVNVGKKINNGIVLNKTLNTTKKIKLEHNENSFSIEFSSTHFVAPNKNKFKYKLEGFNNDWVSTDSKKRYATYTNLPSGNYVFKLKASNNDGIWGNQIKQLQVEISPPFWKTNLAYFIYGLLLLGLFFGIKSIIAIRAKEKNQINANKLDKQKSDELQQMKLEFFTNISHEFRTPLTLISGPLDYLKNNDLKLDAEGRSKQYELMTKNTDYLMRLVNQLLDFRRLDKQKLQLNLKKLNLLEFIEETTGPFLFMANKKKINFQIKAVIKKIELPFDPDALEKILNNLLFNAFKFTPENESISIEIFLGKNFQKEASFKLGINYQDYVLIQIKDTGQGIPPEKLEHIFERYYVENKNNAQGVGIGLSFTKKLVELHKGFIDVKSDLGKGTIFSIFLPLKSSEFVSQVDVIEEESEEFAQDLHFELDKKIEEADSKLVKDKEVLPKLLLIEDNNDIRAFIKQGLENTYKIYEASNGEKGLKVATEQLPSLIISDIMMPKLDGLSMSKQLRENEKTSHIPIILLTAKSSIETEQEALKIGIEDFVRKPFNLDVLILKVNNLIAKKQGLREKYKKEISIEPSDIVVTSVDEKFLERAMSIVENNMSNTKFTVELLVDEIGMSRSNLYLKLKEITGLSSSEFIRSVRLKRAVQLIKKSDMSVKEIMYMTGFNTASYFSKCFKKQYGVVPSEYIKKMKK